MSFSIRLEPCTAENFRVQLTEALAIAFPPNDDGAIVIEGRKRHCIEAAANAAVLLMASELAADDDEVVVTLTGNVAVETVDPYIVVKVTAVTPDDVVEEPVEEPSSKAPALGGPKATTAADQTEAPAKAVVPAKAETSAKAEVPAKAEAPAKTKKSDDAKPTEKPKKKRKWR